jgi:hypothetical protein
MSDPGTSDPASDAATDNGGDPEVVAALLEVVAEYNVDHALSDLEQLIATLRAGAEEATAAREALRRTPAHVLRQALQLRAARIEPIR